MVSVDGDVDVAVKEFELDGINSGMVPLLTNKDISLILYSSCVQSSVA